MRASLLILLLLLAGCSEPAAPAGPCSYLAVGTGNQVLIHAQSFNSDQTADVLIEVRVAEDAEDKYSDGPVIGTGTTDDQGCAAISVPTAGWHAIGTTWEAGAYCGPVGYAEPVDVRGPTEVSLEWGYACT